VLRLLVLGGLLSLTACGCATQPSPPTAHQQCAVTRADYERNVKAFAECRGTPGCEFDMQDILLVHNASVAMEASCAGIVFE
jgi:hypothetical protein